MPKKKGHDAGESSHELSHVVVVGGTPAQWSDMSVEEWSARLRTLTAGASAGGARWATLFPHHGDDLVGAERERFLAVLDAVPGCTRLASDGNPCERRVWGVSSGLDIVVDPCADGHRRFAAVVESLRLAGLDPDDLDEAALSAALLAPATAEPDLVVILGPPDTLPTSLVWELAYSELVFLDLGWSALEASHIELAIDDFNRRHRRFGGLDT